MYEPSLLFPEEQELQHITYGTTCSHDLAEETFIHISCFDMFQGEFNKFTDADEMNV